VTVKKIVTILRGTASWLGRVRGWGGGGGGGGGEGGATKDVGASQSPATAVIGLRRLKQTGRTKKPKNSLCVEAKRQ